MKKKIRPDEKQIENSPWNIAAKFNVDMTFSVKDIAGMLGEYESDYHTGMDIMQMAELKIYPKLRVVLYELLFTGKPIPYNATNEYMKDAAMFGFIRNEKDTAVIFNRIFESVLYNYFISEEFTTSKLYNMGVQEKNQFIVKGHLDIRKILYK